MFERAKQAFSGIREGNAFHRAHGSQAPSAGDMAPDFELCDVDGKNPVRLSGFRDERPVALGFGSFT